MQRDICEAYVIPGKITSINVEEMPKINSNIQTGTGLAQPVLEIKTPYASGNGLADL